MSEIITSSGIDIIRGKFKKSDAGYFYMRNGKQFYRTREEGYQKNQSPRQKWNSDAFKYAHGTTPTHVRSGLCSAIKSRIRSSQPPCL